MSIDAFPREDKTFPDPSQEVRMRFIFARSALGRGSEECYSPLNNGKHEGYFMKIMHFM